MNLIYRLWILLVSVNVHLQMKCWKTDKHAFVCRWAYPVKCSNVVLADDKETVLEVHVEYDRSKSTKPKGVIHWVAEPSPGVEPLKVEVRLFDKLFRSENPAELDDWLADLNPNSREVITDAYAVPPLKHAKEGDRFQFERLGEFFSLDFPS
jgi:glutaminyl-tRNA synthetase